MNGVFQVRVRASRGNSNTSFTASLDAVSVKVDYTTPTTISVTTDALGNLTARGTSTYAYDQANRLVSATVAGTTETSTYDGDGVRFSRQVGAGPAIRFVTDPAAGLPVTLDDGTRKYVWGNGLAYAVSGSTLEVYHADRLGSVRALTDAAGTVTATYRTDEFGIPTATTGSSTQPFAFTGEPRDATGLSYLRARHYDPSLGRFMSRDTWAGGLAAPQTIDRYVYVGSNPATYADPSGRCFQLEAGGLLLAPVTGGASAVAGTAATILCGVAVGALFVWGAAAAWVTGSAAGEALADLSVRHQRRGEVIPPVTDPYPRREELDRRASTPLIVRLEPSELGWGTPGGGSRLPSLCTRLHLSWRSCAALGLGVSAGGGLVYFLHENQEGSRVKRQSE